MMAYSAPASRTIPALTSPVNAPSFSQNTSCDATAMGEFLAASATACTARNGGATTISTPVTSLTMVRNSLAYTTASCTVLNIFQLPAMRGVRMGDSTLGSRLQAPGSRLCQAPEPRDRPGAGKAPEPGARSLFVRQRRHAWQHAASEEFERRAATGGDVRDAVRDAGLVDGRNRITAADDGRPLHARHGFGDRRRAFREGVDLEYAHR